MLASSTHQHFRFISGCMDPFSAPLNNVAFEMKIIECHLKEFSNIPLEEPTEIVTPEAPLKQPERLSH